MKNLQESAFLMAENLVFARAAEEAFIAIDPECRACISGKPFAEIRRNRLKHPLEINLAIQRIGDIKMTAVDTRAYRDQPARYAAVVAFRAADHGIDRLAPAKRQKPKPEGKEMQHSHEKRCNPVRVLAQGPD